MIFFFIFIILQLWAICQWENKISTFRTEEEKQWIGLEGPSLLSRLSMHICQKIGKPYFHAGRLQIRRLANEVHLSPFTAQISNQESPPRYTIIFNFDWLVIEHFFLLLWYEKMAEKLN